MRGDPATVPGSALLPGQAAAPAGPVDLQVTFAVNHGLRRDASRFVEAVRAVTVTDRAAWLQIADRWETFASILRIQSRGQDLGLWPLLRARCTTEEAGVLDAMEAEHAALEAQVQLCSALLVRLAQTGDEDARAALVVRLVACRGALERHLAHEETDALALLQHWLTPAEWRQVDHDHFLSQMSVRHLATMVPWTAYGLPREVRDQLLAQAGLGFRILWWLTRGGFARREARVFGGG